MAKSFLLVLAALLLFPATGLCADAQSQAARIRMTFDGGEVVVGILNNPAGQDFLSLLPLQIKFRDFAGEEKIAYLPRKLTTSGAPTARTMQGDFTYYRPWGNLAVFYRGFDGNEQLTVLGRIESGKEKLASMSGVFSVRIEKIE